MIEFIQTIKTTMQALSLFEIILIASNLIFIWTTIILIRTVLFASKQSLIIRNIFINFSDSCANIIDNIKPNINSSLNNYEKEIQLEFKKLYENLRIDVNQQVDTAKKELVKEINLFQSKLRDKGLEELNLQDIMNERVSLK
jgi:hypothetical protein